MNSIGDEDGRALPASSLDPVASGPVLLDDDEIRRIFPGRDAAQAAILRSGGDLDEQRILTIEHGVWNLRSRNAPDDPLFPAPLFPGAAPWGIEARLDASHPVAPRQAAQPAGIITLVDVKGDDAIAAKLPPAMAGLRISRGHRLALIAAGTNARPDPTLTIGRVTRVIRDVDGSALRAGDLKQGQLYDLWVQSRSQVRILGSGLSLKGAAAVDHTDPAQAGRLRLPTTGGGSQRSGPALFTPALWALEASRGAPGCPPPLALYRQDWSPGTAWLGQVRVDEPPHAPLATPWQDDGDVIHPCVIEFYHAFRGYRYLLGITGYPDRREVFENPLLYGSNDLETWDLLADMPQPLGKTPPLDPGANGHTSDIWLGHDPRTGNLIVGWRLTVRLDGGDSTPDRIVNSLWFRESRDGYYWSPAQKMIEATSDQDSLMSPSVLFDPETCTWHMYSVRKPQLCHRIAKSLSGPWGEPDLVTVPPACRPHHLDVRWVGDTLVFMIHSMARTNLFLGTIANWNEWSFNRTPVIVDPTRGCYKASFLPEMVDGVLSLIIFWTTGAGPRAPSPGPYYQLLIARSQGMAPG